MKATQTASFHLPRLRLLPWTNQKSIPIHFNFHELTYIFSIFQNPGLSLTGYRRPGPLGVENAADGVSGQKHAPARMCTLGKGHSEAVHIPGYSYASRVRDTRHALSGTYFKTNA